MMFPGDFKKDTLHLPLAKKMMFPWKSEKDDVLLEIRKR
jgi:hypothetical protein